MAAPAGAYTVTKPNNALFILDTAGKGTGSFIWGKSVQAKLEYLAPWSGYFVYVETADRDGGRWGWFFTEPKEDIDGNKLSQVCYRNMKDTKDGIHLYGIAVFDAWRPGPDLDELNSLVKLPR